MVDIKQAERDVVKEKAELLKQIQEVLKEYNGVESNIPLNHNYWNLLNQYRLR